MIASGGLGVGSMVPIGRDADLIPFATAQIRWDWNKHQYSCPDCTTYGSSETVLYLRGEIGLSVQVNRFYFVGGYRAFVDHDPLFQLRGYDDATQSLFSLGTGFLF